MMAAKGGAQWKYDSAASIMDEIASVTPTYEGISYDKFQGIQGIQWPCNKAHPQGCERFMLEDAAGKLNFVPVVGSFQGSEAHMGYPFLLMIGKAEHFWHQNNLMKRTFMPKREYNATLLLYPKGYVEIHPDDAKELQVRDKWPVRVTSSFGSMSVTVKVSEDVKKETAYVPYFIRDMISDFLMEHKDILEQGEDSIIPVRIEKV